MRRCKDRTWSAAGRTKIFKKRRTGRGKVQYEAGLKDALVREDRISAGARKCGPGQAKGSGDFRKTAASPGIVLTRCFGPRNNASLSADRAVVLDLARGDEEGIRTYSSQGSSASTSIRRSRDGAAIHVPGAAAQGVPRAHRAQHERLNLAARTFQGEGSQSAMANGMVSHIDEWTSNPCSDPLQVRPGAKSRLRQPAPPARSQNHEEA